MREHERTFLENSPMMHRPAENMYTRPNIIEREHLRSFPLENNLQEQPRFEVPFRERLLEANELSGLHHRHRAVLDPNLISGAIAAEEPTLLPGHRMFIPTVGALGDETLPYGSLGETKPGEYIPVGRVSNLPEFQVCIHCVFYIHCIFYKPSL